VVLGAAVVFAGVGIAGIVEHGAQVSDYNNDSSCPSISASSRPAQCNDLVNSANTWTTVAVVSFVASGIALVGGVTLWLTAPGPTATTRASAFHCYGSFASLGCAGTF
jgi:hypothetical protein